MRLAELCHGICRIKDPGLKDLEISGLSSDSRQILPGTLFVAVKGFKTDGHRYLEEAVAKGAVAAIVDRHVSQQGLPILQVSDSRKAAALLAARFYDNPAKDLTMVGITGTNGKTTLTFLLESIFSKEGRNPGVMGTLNYRWCGLTLKATHTTPDAILLQKNLDNMRRCGVDCVIMEVSSHALALYRTEGISFDAAVFTNLSRDHLDFHGTEDEYAATKSRLFAQLKNKGTALINADDEAAPVMLSSAGEKSVTYGFTSKDADFRITDVELGWEGSRFCLKRGDDTLVIETPLIGIFNVMNAAAAAACGMVLGLKHENIIAGLARPEPVPGRMELVAPDHPIQVIVDYAHTPDALRKVIETLRELCRGRLVVVFGCGGDRDRGKRPLMGQFAEELADMVIVTSDNPRSEDPKRIVDDILAGMGNPDKVTVIENREEAIRYAIEKEARPGDTVLIAGKGHESEQIIGNERIHFDDREIARACLARTGGE